MKISVWPEPDIEDFGWPEPEIEDFEWPEPEIDLINPRPESEGEEFELDPDKEHHSSCHRLKASKF